MELKTNPTEIKTPLPLPKYAMPNAWWNEDEISYFFSPFRSYNQNPSDKENKLKFWKPLISDWCEYNKKCTFTLSELEKTFRWNQLVPACLSGVIDDLLRSCKVTTKEEFVRLPSLTWSGWALDLFIKRPAGWTFKKAKEMVKIQKAEEEPIYVHLEAVELQGNHLFVTVQDACRGRILSKADVKKLVPFLNDVDIVLHWLVSKGRIVIGSYKDEDIIKFADSDDRVSSITETDCGIYALLETEKSLSNHVEVLETEKLATIEMAKCYLKKGMKQMAKNALRKKQELEKCLIKRSSVLENVQTLLSRIQESHSDAKILETYQQGLVALKLTMKEANLSDDNVSNTMIQINEVLDIHEEIQEAMANTSRRNDEEELEVELAQLLLSDGSPPSVDHKTKEPDLNITSTGLPADRKIVTGTASIKDLPKIPDELPSQRETRVVSTSS